MPVHRRADRVVRPYDENAIVYRKFLLDVPSAFNGGRGRTPPLRSVPRYPLRKKEALSGFFFVYTFSSAFSSTWGRSVVSGSVPVRRMKARMACWSSSSVPEMVFMPCFSASCISIVWRGA